MAKAVYIYTLECPDTNVIKYVGKTVNADVNKRLSQHICDSKRFKYKSSTWIRSLVNNGKEPIINTIDVVDYNDWQFWEKYWISQIKAWGFDLKNHESGGGFNQDGRPSWNKGIKLSKEHKEKLSKAKINYVPYNKGKSKIDMDMVFYLNKQGKLQKEIAKILSIDASNVSRILNNKYNNRKYANT